MVTELKDEPVQKEEVSSSETKPGKLLCCPQEGCGKVFRSSPGYRYHLKSHDQDPRPHVCHCCHKKFKSANGLKYHLRKAHHIEPVLSKQNLNGVNPKNCDSLGNEDDHFLALNDSYSRNLLNGNYPDRRSNIPSPLVKSPLGLSSPMMKNLPGIPSPLLKSPMDIGPYLSGGSSGSGINSPYTKDRYSHFYDKLSENHLQRNGEYSRRPPNDDYGRSNVTDFSSGYSRSSLSEYSQQCQQTNNDYRQQQCQRQYSANDNYNSYPPRSSCDYYTCRKTEPLQQHSSGGVSGCGYPNDYHRSSSEPDYHRNPPPGDTDYHRNPPPGDSDYHRNPPPGDSDYHRNPPPGDSDYHRNPPPGDSDYHRNPPPGDSDYHRTNSMRGHNPPETLFDQLQMNSNGGGAGGGGGDHKDFNGSRHHKEYGSCNKDYTGIPNEGKEYPNDLVNHNPQCTAPHVKTSYNSHNSCTNPYDEPPRGENPAFRKTNSHIAYAGHQPYKDGNSEQIVPDIGVPSNSSPPGSNGGCDISSSDVKDFRGASESSNETELSDCAFQNESTELPLSPSDSARKSCLADAAELGFATIKSEPSSPDSTSAITSSHSHSHSASSLSSDVSKPLLVRRTSKSKSIPSALVINPSIKSDLRPPLSKGKEMKDLSKLDPASRLRHLAEIATSPRSPLNQMPLPLALTPSLLPPESTPHIPLKSPSRFSFPEKPFLLTPTISRYNPDTSHSDSPITTTTSLPASPSFLNNIQTPSFWPSQTWPIPVWLCFLQGCHVKLGQDDKQFMMTEEVAAFCTTPGGRRRDDMNFYTSGMKIVDIKEEDQSLSSAQDMVELTFEQVIPGTQRLVAKCPIDHPFYVKNKGWCAANPTEAMARYGIPFLTLRPSDTAIPSPANKLNQTPNNVSPLVSGKGPNVFTFNVNETSKFSPPKSNGSGEKQSSVSSGVSTKPGDTITLTYSAKSSTVSSSNNNTNFPHKNLSTIQPKLASELKFISDSMKQNNSNGNSNSNNTTTNTNTSCDRTSHELRPSSPESMIVGEGEERRAAPRKKRRKPAVGNEEERRPMNGFMLFAKKMRVELTKLYPGKDNRAVSKLLGEKWRELSEEKRDDFARNAKEMADERMKLNPDCWKRKHRKDKEAGGGKGAEGPTGGAGAGVTPDQKCKQMKLSSPQHHQQQHLSPQHHTPSQQTSPHHRSSPPPHHGHHHHHHPSPPHKTGELQLPSSYMDNNNNNSLNHTLNNSISNSLLLKVGDDGIKVEDGL